jgi:hypothetical protein
MSDHKEMPEILFSEKLKKEKSYGTKRPIPCT